MPQTSHFFISHSLSLFHTHHCFSSTLGTSITDSFNIQIHQRQHTCPQKAFSSSPFPSSFSSSLYLVIHSIPRKGSAPTDALDMGKVEDQPQIQETGIETSTSSRECCCSTKLVGPRKAFTFRCIAVLILGAGVFLSSAFWLRHFHSTKSGFDAGFVGEL